MAPTNPTEKSVSGVGLAKAVVRGTLQHPVTLFSTATGFLGGLTFLLLEPTTLFATLGVGGLALGVGSWAFNYFVRGQTFESEYLRKLSDELKERNAALLKDLQRKLAESQSIPDAEKYAEQALQQFEISDASFTNFEELLSEKLDPSELTHGRYRVTAEQVHHSVLDNLERVASALASIRAIDPDYIAQRLAALNRMKSPLAEADRQEIETLEERKKLRASQLDKVNTLLTYNEQAMTKLNKACTAVADMNTKKGRASIDLESAMAALQDLSQRASRYR